MSTGRGTWPRVGATLSAVMVYGMFVVVAANCLADEPAPPPKRIGPELAAEHVGQTCIVEMDVRSARRGDSPICFLNSETDYRDEKNFTVVIFEEGLTRFKKKGIESPERHFDGKKIRVTGEIEDYRGRAQIRLDDPSRIEIVEKPAEAPPKSEGE